MNDSQLESLYLKIISNDSVIASAKVCNQNRVYGRDIESLYQQLTNLLDAKPALLDNLEDEKMDAAAGPTFWISKWFDHNERYGFGYQLCNKGVGVIFNDSTKLIIFPNKRNVRYVDKEGKMIYMRKKRYYKVFFCKMIVLSFFKGFMTKNLVKTGPKNVNTESIKITRMPHLHSWLRTKYAVVMHLTNGTVQFNFADHTKIILCPRKSAVTCMDQDNLRTYRFSTLAQGCSKEVFYRIRYAHDKLGAMLGRLFF